jgi:hypothetical protein
MARNLGMEGLSRERGAGDVVGKPWNAVDSGWGNSPGAAKR